MQDVFFDSWASLGRTALLTVLGYAAMVTALRLSGKRTLAKMSAFDFVVTVALGSCLATIALNKTLPLAEGVLAFSLLIGLQFVLTWLSVRVRAVRWLLTSQPTLLLYQGELLPAALKASRVTPEEIYSAARQQGIADLRRVDAVILEPTGDISFLEKAPAGASPVVGAVPGYPPPAQRTSARLSQ